MICTFPYFKSTSGSWRVIPGVLVVSLLCLVDALGGGVRDYLKKTDEWFATDDAARVARNVISWQAEAGGWPKNVDTAIGPHDGDRRELKGTFDNGATTDELRFLARCIGQEKESKGDDKLTESFNRGLRHILMAQYPTGGWPQLFPPGKGYHRHITFNDDSMVRIMEFLREVNTSKQYSFLASADREAAGHAFGKGIECILRCQIIVSSKPTVWCAQHDEIDLRPRDGRSFELASFSGSESVGITRLLMSLENPDEHVVAAVEGAVAWFEAEKITGLRAERHRTDDGGMELVMEKDADAPSLWGRFHDLKTGEPFFCERDGVPRPSITDLAPENRASYAWYGTWAASLLEKDYPGWKARLK